MVQQRRHTHPNPSMTRHIRVIIKNTKKKHSSKRFGIVIPTAVAIDDAAPSLYDSIDFEINGEVVAYMD